jgi:serine/threonine-protein kinase RIM15
MLILLLFNIVAAMMIPQSAHARRSSISLSAATSPIKRREIINLAGARDDPTSPSRRRRSSALPPRSVRTTELGQRLGRALTASMDRSNASSRSNSRSRSPMPSLVALAGSLAAQSDDPDISGLVEGLQKVISIATDVTETPVSVLIAKPSTCRHFIERVREVGSIWDENPEAKGRNWYIRLLLAIAGLSRVVEWWEAERGFWNFDNDEDNEPMTFVLKPAREGETSGTPPVQQRHLSEPGSGFGTPVSVSSMSDAPHISPGLMLPPSQVEDLVTARPTELSSAVPSQIQAAQDLQLQAEHNKSINIVLELSLGGELIEWVNPAWREVTGSVPGFLGDRLVLLLTV